jgi:hypothetical protein
VSHDGRVHMREVWQDVPKGGALLREADEDGSVSAGTAAPPRNERHRVRAAASALASGRVTIARAWGIPNCHSASLASARV